MKKNRDTKGKKIARDKKINKVIMIGIIAAVAIIIGFSISSIKFSSNANATPPIDGIKCEAMELGYFHKHLHLSIFINGQNYTVPALIGITDNCFYWLHTHDNTGIIHIESPVKRNFTLGNFFDIWKQKFSNTQILNNTADSNHPLNVYVNGTKVPNSTNFGNINLHAHDVIAIVYGKTPNIILSKYNFGSL